MSWQTEIVTRLLEQRAGGERDFGRAWRHAVAGARAAGYPRPRDYVSTGNGEAGWQPFSSFFRHACELEWRGLVHADYAGLREMLADGTVRQEEKRAGSRVHVLG